MSCGCGDRGISGSKERAGISDHLLQPGVELRGQKDTLTIVPEMARGHADACPLHIHRLYYVSL